MRLPTRRLGVAAGITVALLYGTLAAAGPASADAVGPVLTSVSVSSATVTPGQVVQLHYTASSSAPLASVNATYRNDSTYLQFPAASVAPLPADGTIDISIPQGARNVATPLTAITLVDTQGAKTIWGLDGTVRYSGGAAGASTHSVDFTAGGLTVTGSTEDSTSPVLTSLTLAKKDLVPGDTLGVHYEVSDASALKEVEVSYDDAVKGFPVTLDAQTAPVPASGDLTSTVDDTWANGVATITEVTLWDIWGNASVYYPDGRYEYAWPPQYGTHTIDLASVAFNVSGSPADHEAPVLTSLGPIHQLYVTRTGTVAIPYSATDASGRLASISVVFLSNDAHRYSVAAADIPLSGTLTSALDLPSTFPSADYWIESVTLIDPGGSKSVYHWGGRTDYNRARVADHTFDFGSMHLPVADPPGAMPYAYAVPGDASATISWDLDLGDDGYAPLTGITVTASPSGKSVTVGPSSTTATITGLTNGTRYTFSIRRNNAVGSSAPLTRTTTPRGHGQHIISPGDFDYDGRMDVVGIDKSGALHLYRGNGRGGFAAPGKVIARGWQDERMLVATPGDSRTIRTVNYDGRLVDHQAKGSSGIGFERPFSSGFGGMSKVFGVGDWSGDGLHDLMAVRDDGALYFYRYRWQDGSLSSGVRIGSGWNVYRQVFGVGDETGDGRNDLVGLRSDGSLWLYAGNDRGGFIGGGRKIATGFAGARAIMAASFDGHTGMDLLTVDAKGNLRLYSGSTRAHFTYRGVIGTGWTGFL